MAAGAYDGRVIGAHGTPSEKTGLNFIPSVMEAAPGARIRPKCYMGALYGDGPRLDGPGAEIAKTAPGLTA